MAWLWLRKWAAILLTPSLKFVPTTMNMREGFDLRLCRLVDGSALLYVPHGGRTGMFYCEVEMALGLMHAASASEYLIWVNAEGWSDWNQNTVSGREMISVGDTRCMAHDKRRLSPWMAWMIKWRMQRTAELDHAMRHYQNYHFMSLLNHLWDSIDRRPKGFVERWALKGPEAADDAWTEAVSVSPALLQKNASSALFEVLKEEARVRP